MRILIHCFGSTGDEAPFIRLGMALQECGHDVQMLMNPSAKEKALDLGLGFISVGDRFDIENHMRKKYLHPVWGGTYILRELFIPNARAAYTATKKAIETHGADLVISHFMCWGSSWAAQQASIPYVNISLAPMVWLSHQDPGISSAMIPWRWLLEPLLRFSEWMTNLLVSRPVSKLRTEIGLSPDHKTYFTHFDAAASNIALWSPTYRPKISDDPPHSIISGFSLGPPDAPLDARIVDFVQRGAPPVVVGFGSSTRMGAGHVYANAASACRSLGLRSILVGAPNPSLDVPSEDVLSVPYAPYAALFPHAAVIVHPAGAGTMAEALRAGVPTVMIPFANDQFDNAWRAEQLGTGIQLSRNRVSQRALKKALLHILKTPSIQDRAQKIGQQLQKEPDGAQQAARHIESLV